MARSKARSKTIRSKLALQSSVVALCGLTMASPPAAAQQVALEEIVVTARKRAESLQDIPLSITAFSSEMIEKAGIRTIDDIAKLTSSLVFETSFVPQDTRPVIRGISPTRGRQPIGVLLDGIDVSSESLLTGGGGIGVNLRLVDVERIEVVKGPQSALYGRVAFGGAINYISKKPSDVFEGRLFTDVGENGQFELSGSVSGPVVEDKFALRVNASYAQHNGFHTNAISGEKIGDYDSIGGAIAAEFTPSDVFTVNARVSYSEDEAGPAAQYYLGVGNGGTQQAPLPAGAQPLIDQGVFPATLAVAPPGELLAPANIQLSLDPLTGDDYPGSRTEALYTSLLTEYDFGSVKLNTWTGFSKVDGEYRVDTDFFGLPAIPVTFPFPGGVAEPLGNSFESDASTTAKQFNQEIRIGDLESDGLRWALGGLYWDENYDMDSRTLLTGVFGPPGLSSAELNTQLGNPKVSQPTFRNTEHWSVYGMAEYDITDQLAASVEVRYSDESFEYQWFSGGTFAASFGPPAGTPAPGVQFNASASEDFFAPKFTLEYQVNDDALVYASASKGVKPGGFSTVAAPELENARYIAEKLWNYELGAKTTLAEGRLQLNGSVFLMKYSDKQFQTLIPDDTAPNGLAGKTVNAANSEVRGLELDITAAPTDGLILGFGYTLLDSEYTSFTNFVNSGVGVVLAGVCEPTVLNGVSGCNVISDGFSIERSPKHSLLASVSYTMPITDELDAFLNVDAQYQDKRYIDTTELHYFGSYWNMDARIGVETEAWSVFAYGKNILDDDTPRGGTGTGDFHPFGSAAFALNAAPKSQYGVRASYAW